MHGARFVPIIAAVLLVAITSACVDHEANAVAFCKAVDSIVASDRDGEDLAPEDVQEIADDVALAMRDAEDATRDVRSAGRDMSVAYDDLVALLDDDETTSEEIEDVRGELQAAREDVRHACGGSSKSANRVTSFSH